MDEPDEFRRNRRDNPGMAEDERPRQVLPGYLHRLAEEHRTNQIERYGEEGYSEREKVKDAVISDVIQRANPLIDEARRRGFVFVRCDTNRDAMSLPVTMQFADGKGQFYERSLPIAKDAAKHGLRVTLSDAVDVRVAVESYVRGLDGFKGIESGMKRRRVRANG
jgi:hypothetical protein